MIVIICFCVCVCVRCICILTCMCFSRALFGRSWTCGTDPVLLGTRRWHEVDLSQKLRKVWVLQKTRGMKPSCFACRSRAFVICCYSLRLNTLYTLTLKMFFFLNRCFVVLCSCFSQNTWFLTVLMSLKEWHHRSWCRWEYGIQKASTLRFI